MERCTLPRRSSERGQPACGSAWVFSIVAFGAAFLSSPPPRPACLSALTQPTLLATNGSWGLAAAVCLSPPSPCVETLTASVMRLGGRDSGK